MEFCDGMLYYLVNLSAPNGSIMEMKNLSSNISQYNFTKLMSNTSYTVHVTAVYTLGKDSSNKINVTTVEPKRKK